jgi:nitrite reductase (NADH) small subunit
MTAVPIQRGAVVQYDLGSIDRIPPGEGQTFLVAGREIAVFRARGSDEVHATQARCPHKAGLLADGIVGDGKVICPLHSYKFDLATGTPLGNACHSLKTYRTELTADRRVLLWLSPSAVWDGSA